MWVLVVVAAGASAAAPASDPAFDTDDDDKQEQQIWLLAILSTLSFSRSTAAKGYKQNLQAWKKDIQRDANRRLELIEYQTTHTRLN